MSKKFIKIIAVIIVVATLMSSALSTAALAAELRESAYIASMNAEIVAAGSGKVRIEFAVTGTGIMTQIGANVIRIYTSSGTLVEIYGYYNAGYEDMMGYNKGRHSGDITHSGTAGQSYYAVVTGYAKNSSGSDSKIYTTSTITAV